MSSWPTPAEKANFIPLRLWLLGPFLTQKQRKALAKHTDIKSDASLDFINLILEEQVYKLTDTAAV